jgi:hypothetical protein
LKKTAFDADEKPEVNFRVIATLAPDRLLVYPHVLWSFSILNVLWYLLEWIRNGVSDLNGLNHAQLGSVLM